MRFALMALLLVALLGCGKKEEPRADAPAPIAVAPSAADAPIDCMDVVVVSVEGTGNEARSVFEFQKDGRAHRVARGGWFGAVGDRFTYCNYYSQPK